MRMTCFVVAALALASVSSVHAQRRFRLGPMLSSLSLEDASGTGHGFTAWGGSIALITGDDGETGLTVARYGDLALNSCERSLTLYALRSEEHTSELQSHSDLVCRLLLEKKKKKKEQ